MVLLKPLDLNLFVLALASAIFFAFLAAFTIDLASFLASLT
jgi:hypothetical protein